MIYKARQKMSLYRIAMKETLDKNMGNQVNFQVWENLAAATSPMLPSVTPQGSNIQATDILATLEIYGNWVPMNRHVMNTLEDNYLQRGQNVMAYNMKDTFETIDAYALKQGSEVVYSNADTVRTDVDKAMTLETLRDAVSYLEANNAEPITELIPTRPNIEAVGIEEAYFGFCHSHMERVVRGLTGFVPAARYPDTMERLPNEIGSVENVRFIRSNYFTPWADGGASVSGGFKSTSGSLADVYPVVIFAKDAFGVSDLAGTEFNKLMVANPRTLGGVDPLGQRGSIGWCGCHAISIIDNDRMVRIESAAPISSAA